MSLLKIDVERARAFFEHPSQHKNGASPDNIPGDPVQYWAEGPVCMAFHPFGWPGVWACHVAVKPEAWGNTVGPCKRLIAALINAERPERLVAWIDERDRHVMSLAKRVGFVRDGTIPLENSKLAILGYES